MPRYTIGVDLGGTNLKAAIFQDHLQSIIEKNVSTEADKRPEHVLLRIQETVTGLIAEAGLAQGEIACMGMGMGIPGLLDPVRGLSIFSPNLPGWANVSVVREMERCFPFPVSIDNDVRVNLYGEWHCGAGVGYRDLVLLTLGTGLGCLRDRRSQARRPGRYDRCRRIRAGSPDNSIKSVKRKKP